MENDSVDTREMSYTTISSTALDRKTQEHIRQMQKEEHSHKETVLKMQQDNNVGILKQKLGIIGRLFGDRDNSSKNITAFLNILLIIGASTLSAIIYINDKDIQLVSSIWKNVIPIVTLSLGYLFGKK